MYIFVSQDLNGNKNEDGGAKARRKVVHVTVGISSHIGYCNE